MKAYLKSLAAVISIGGAGVLLIVGFIYNLEHHPNTTIWVFLLTFILGMAYIWKPLFEEKK